MEPQPAGRQWQYAADDEERFRLLVKNSTDMVYRRTVAGVFLEVSAAGPALLGCPAEDIVGTTFATWVHPGDMEDFEAAERDLLRAGRVAVCLRLRHTDGHWVWTEMTSWAVRDAAGGPLEIRGFLREAEAQRRREETLRVLQEQARSVIDTARDAFVSIDEDGLVIDWNHSAEALFGYSRREVMGRPLTETIIPERFHEAHLTGLRRVLDGGEPHVLGRQIETTARHRDGHAIPVELGVWRLKSGPARCFNAFIRDISERKQIEAALAEARDEAVAASRAKSDFVASISHEIRTPMNGVIGLSELALGTELDPVQRRYIEGVQAAGRALLSLINDILDFSKLEAGKLELDETAFSPQLLVEEVVSLVAQTPRAEGLELLSDCTADLPVMARGDAGRLRQILLNLASNAVKFTEQGEVVVRAAPAPAQPPAQGLPWLRFEVTDTGIGIAEEQQERMFDAFSQADASTTRRYGGTGLGLAICRRLAEAMGGSIGVKSRLGEGSTFWFTVPVRPPHAAERAPVTAQPVRLRGLRVLVVDDNETNRLILDTQLRSWHMQPTAVEGGPQALVALHEAAAAGRSFDLAILDMRMPGMDGLELARRITTTQALARMPLLMLSSGPPLPMAELNAAGIARSLPKPVRSSELMDTLSELMAPTAPGAPATAQPPATSVTAQQPAPPFTVQDPAAPAATPAPAAAVTPPSTAQPPAASATAQSPGPESAPTPAPLGHLLLAEDNEINQMVAVGLLTRLGYGVDVASDGQRALALSAEKSYDAVLMDCQMPTMDGYTATRNIRSREAGGDTHLPVIAMTASALPEDRQRCLAAGMDDYVSKPVSAEELQDVLARHVRPAEREQEHPEPEPDDVADGADVDDLALRAGIGARLDDLRGAGSQAELELVDRLVDHFLTRTPDMTRALFHALDRGDASEIADHAHSLKGAAGNMGAESLAARCEELEQLARAGKPPPPAETAPRLRAELDRTCRVLETLRPSPPRAHGHGA